MPHRHEEDGVSLLSRGVVGEVCSRVDSCDAAMLRCCDAAMLRCCDAAMLPFGVPFGTRHRGVVFRRVGRHRVLRQSGDVVLDRKRVLLFFGV